MHQFTLFQQNYNNFDQSLKNYINLIKEIYKFVFIDFLRLRIWCKNMNENRSKVVLVVQVRHLWLESLLSISNGSRSQLLNVFLKVLLEVVQVRVRHMSELVSKLILKLLDLNQPLLMLLLFKVLLVVELDLPNIGERQSDQVDEEVVDVVDVVPLELHANWLVSRWVEHLACMQFLGI